MSNSELEMAIKNSGKRYIKKDLVKIKQKDSSCVGTPYKFTTLYVRRLHGKIVTIVRTKTQKRSVKSETSTNLI